MSKRPASGGAAPAPAKKQKKRAPRPGQEFESKFFALCQRYPDGLKEDVLAREMSEVDVKVRADMINSLAARRRLAFLQTADNKIAYKLIGKKESDKTGGMSQEESVVYQLVKEEGAKGVWRRIIVRKSHLPPLRVDKILKALINQQIIKAVKGVQGKQKVYMLFELEPEKQLAVWYDEDGKFDAEFLATATKICVNYLKKKGASNADEICSFVKSKSIFAQPPQPSDIAGLLFSLSCDANTNVEIDPSSLAVISCNTEEVSRQTRLCYRLCKKAAFSPLFNDIPCCCCPVRDKCTMDGAVNPRDCEYIAKWLEF